MAMTLRHRAVCALALLALLCGCSFVCGANAEGAVEASDNPPPDVGGKIFLPVDVACKSSEGKLRWRFPGEEGWKICATDASKSKDDVAWLCDSAAWLYGCSSCTQTCAAAEIDAVAFRMKVAAYGKSELYNKSLTAKNAGADFSFFNTTGVCASAAGNIAGNGCSDEKTTAVETPASAPFSLPEGPEARREDEAVGAQSAQKPQEGEQRSAGKVAAGAGPDHAAGLTVQEPAESAPQSAGTAPAAAAAPGAAGGRQAHGVESTPQTAESVGASGVPPKPSAQPQAGGELAEGRVGGATGQTNAAEGSEEAEGGAERPTTTEHGGDSTDSAQSTAGATQASAHEAATTSGATQKAVTNAADRSATSTPLVRASPLLLLMAALACAAG
ncbi:mucin-like glycoprotein [Trypanosoma conorhini]|uniref:Mucin-like glycoprotein n=1 Tax=Trypanosoma conorhini TaxID=83891 RepID=A0A3R7M617_9TRYP|nr:mucin-like glycoprotein [Trypanosoma conorhini]RNE96817.1 mucin-like glycoprotein [Trypanosoma conorhini]